MRSNGLLRGSNEAAGFMLDLCCRPVSTNTGMKGRWNVRMGDLQYVILYHKEHISNKKKTPDATAMLRAPYLRLKC